jgi:hypothetical protein
MLRQNENQTDFKKKFAAALIIIGILVTIAVIKNADIIKFNKSAQMNKTGFVLHSFNKQIL